MASSALQDAKAKLEEATAGYAESFSDSWTAQSIYENRVGDALSLAKEALVTFRKAGDMQGRMSALSTVVEAHLALNDAFAALLVASDELAMIKRSGDKSAQLKALDLVANTQLAKGDGVGALSTTEEWVALAKELGEKEPEAKALRIKAALCLSMGKKSEASLAGEASLKLFKEMGSKEGEEAANSTLSSICCEKGLPDKAPNRPAAISALRDMDAAVSSRDQQGWNRAMEALSKTCAYVQKDIDEIVNKVTEGNERGAVSFLQEQGLAMNHSGSKDYAREVVKRMTYIGFRMGGLGYGPRFRCIQAYAEYVNNVPQALATLQVSDEAEDWEKELCYQPGILDGCLQTQSSLG